MKRDHIEIAGPNQANAEHFRNELGEMVEYRPTLESSPVIMSVYGLDSAQGRLISFLGVTLPREAIYQVVSAYLLGVKEALDEDA